MDVGFLNGPIGGALIALVTGVVVFWLNERREMRLEGLKDARSLRDTRRERLRDSYERLLILLAEARSTAVSAGTSKSGISPELHEALDNFRLAEERLRIEDESGVVDRIDKVFEVLLEAVGASPGHERVEALARYDNMVAELRQSIVKSLRRLEQPITKI